MKIHRIFLCLSLSIFMLVFSIGGPAMAEGMKLSLETPSAEILRQLDIAVFNAAVNNIGEITERNFSGKLDAIERAETLEEELTARYGEDVLLGLENHSLLLSARTQYDYYGLGQTPATGDINSDKKIDASDALLALQHSVALVNLTGDQFAAADVNGSSVVDASDALLILQYSVDLISEFPLPRGNYANVDENLMLLWEPSSTAKGSAAGFYSLTVGETASGGRYDIYFADDGGILDDYAPIVQMNLEGTSQAGYNCFIEQNLLPPEATRLVAVQSNEIKAYVDIPQEKRLDMGELLYTHAILSDVHVFSDLNNELNGFEELVTALETFQSLKIDQVSIDGDLNMNFAATDSQAKVELAVIKAIFDKYSDVDIHVCKGNHDKVTDEQEWEALFGETMDYSFTRNGETFIYLSLLTVNNIGSNDTTAYGEEKLAWLEQEMKQAAGGRIYLFLHYPFPGYAGLKPTEYYGFTATSTEYNDILNLIRRYGNTYVFSGHTHYDFMSQEQYSGITVTPIEGTNSYTVHVPSLAYPRASSGSQLTTESQGFLVETYEDGILLKGIDFKQNGKIIPIGSYVLESKINPYYLSEAPDSMVAGETAQLEVLGKEHTEVEWSSSNKRVLTVDQQGKITAIAAGKAIITAVVDGYTLSVNISVTEPVPITYPEDIILAVGEVAFVGPTGDYTSLSVVSPDSSVVSVDAAGYASALKEGTVTLTAIVDGMEYTVLVTVVDAPSEYPGEGTLEDPYRISTATQFVTLQKEMKDGNTFEGKYFIQTADLNLNYSPQYTAMEDAGNTVFSGTYNGNGYTIHATVSPTNSSFAPPFFWYINGTVVNTGFDVNIKGCASTSYGICRQFTEGGRMINCYLTGTIVGNNAHTTIVGGTSQGATIDNMYTYVVLEGAEPTNSGVSIKGGTTNHVDHFYYVDNGCKSSYPDGETCVSLEELEELSATLTENTGQLSLDNIQLCSWYTRDDLPAMNHDGAYSVGA